MTPPASEPPAVAAPAAAPVPKPPDAVVVSRDAPFVEPPQGAPVAPDPLAETARNNASAALRGRADGLFDDDRRLKLDPMIKAAGVSVRRVPISGGPVRR